MRGPPECAACSGGYELLRIVAGEAEGDGAIRVHLRGNGDVVRIFVRKRWAPLSESGPREKVAHKDGGQNSHVKVSDEGFRAQAAGRQCRFHNYGTNCIRLGNFISASEGTQSSFFENPLLRNRLHETPYAPWDNSTIANAETAVPFDQDR